MIHLRAPFLVFLAILLSCAKPENDKPSGLDIPDRKGATVKGAVLLDSGKGLSGVVVSDGVEVTTTDENGFFWLSSKLKNGSVFISIPSGYMPECDGALPRFWQSVSPSSTGTPLYFTLKEEENDSFDLVVSTDYHLADRYDSKDVNAFKEFFIPALKDVQAQAGGKPVYNLVLGDMTWDIYWDQLNLDRYKAMAKQFPVKTFHAIGNHDYDMSFSDDAKAAGKYSAKLGPLWYSFNIGKNHFVVLDDIVYKNTGGNRNHDTYVSDEQVEWLKKDLSYVPAGYRIFVAMHCTAFSIQNISSKGVLQAGLNFEPASKEAALLECLKGREVHFLTGDTHVNQSIPPESGCVSGADFYEHNVAAVCSSWWWTWYLSRNHICKDGSEGGFLVFSADGTDLRWKYRTLSFGYDRQFRAYDMNVVKTVVDADPQYAAFYHAYPSREKYGSIPANAVLVNVFNWDPRWRVKVTENGTELPVTWKSIEDPFHTLSYDVPRVAENGEYTSSFRTIKTEHIFLVTASSAVSTLEIEVEDAFGNIYRESMQRPRPFTLDQYR
ncbi:MAG: calcineurin-like phosphoesterase C-terminal domain-containing protein [Bacteroidales bacterium]|nr:calcineurin-like phosphoesterase C-terminal domain-containing protein [Bacteroidales bacterium]